MRNSEFKEIKNVYEKKCEADYDAGFGKGYSLGLERGIALVQECLGIRTLLNEDEEDSK